jgi:hypothetical protein
VTDKRADTPKHFSSTHYLSLKVDGLPMGSRMHVVPTEEDMDSARLLAAARSQPERGIRVKAAPGLREIGLRWVITWAEVTVQTDRLHVVLLAPADRQIGWNGVTMTITRPSGPSSTYRAADLVRGPSNAVEIIQFVRSEDYWIVQPGAGRIH